MNTIPDSWGLNERFILLPVNKWNNDFARVHIGGISCDHSDYYNFEDLNQQVFLPTFNNDDPEPLYIGFSTPEPIRMRSAGMAASNIA